MSTDYEQQRDKLRDAELALMHQREHVAQLRRDLPPGPTVEDYAFGETTGETTGSTTTRIVHEPSGSVIETMAPVDNGGEGLLFSPTDLCATSLGTCGSTIMSMYASNVGIDLKGIRFAVEKEMSANPRRIGFDSWAPAWYSDRMTATDKAHAEEWGSAYTTPSAAFETGNEGLL